MDVYEEERQPDRRPKDEFVRATESPQKRRHLMQGAECDEEELKQIMRDNVKVRKQRRDSAISPTLPYESVCSTVNNAEFQSDSPPFTVKVVGRSPQSRAPPASSPSPSAQ